MVAVPVCILGGMVLNVLAVACSSRVMLHRASVIIMPIGLRTCAFSSSGSTMNSGSDGSVHKTLDLSSSIDWVMWPWRVY